MQEVIIVGDRVLIEPENGEKQTQSGLYLPATVTDQERVSIGRVVRTGPGYVIPNPEYSETESWAPSRDAARYLPLQARPGDLAFFLRKELIEISLNGKDYVIVPHGAILALIRDNPEDLLSGIEGLETL
ncbi:MAG: co-chaperone GroES family protein [Rhodothermales bacterium]